MAPQKEAAPGSYRAAAREWLADDPDPETRQELEALLEASDEQSDRDLAERFSRTLEFGTAGLRGLLGAGPNRMNRRVVLQTTAGFCRYLLSEVPDAATRGVCIGFDGRRKSREFAEAAASAAAGAGLCVHAFDELVPTPLLAFAVRELRAAGGIMITASHNPPDYNGYKVYWENGAQIIPPHDQGIRQVIQGIDRVRSLVLSTSSESPHVRLGPDVLDRYFAQIAVLPVHPEAPRDFSIAYTALHGVGEPFMRRALDEAGFASVHSVREQAAPDGSFPTVSFPNPEEPGAMDRVLRLAREVTADLVIANDPDADRLAVAVRTGSTYRELTGNEIGCLLAHYLLQERPDPGGATRLVINTIVSSPMLGAIAKAHGARYEQTLTGFKWIANLAMNREAEGYRFEMGYEEALGYTVGSVVRDKDGIGSAVLIADMAAWCRSAGRTLVDELAEMARRYGTFPSRQHSVVMPGVDGVAARRSKMEQLRREPPDRFGGFRVTAVSDGLTGTRRTQTEQTRLDLPSADILIFEVAETEAWVAARVMVRPSGTEPKLKFYFDAEVAGDSPPDSHGSQSLDELAEAVFRLLGLEGPEKPLNV